jgi:tetratricopeptide (TPR) repeat protein
MELTKSSICDLRSLGTIDLNHDDDFNDETQSSVVSVIFDDLDAFHTARCSSSASLDIDVLKEDWNILSDAQLRSGENGPTKYCGNRRRCISAGNQRIVARGRSNSSNNPVKCTGAQNNNELSMPSTDTLYERETDSIGSVNPTSQSQSSNLSFTDPDGDECRNSREDSSKTSLHDTTRLFEEGTDPIASCDYDDNHTHTALDTIYQTEDENEIIEKHDIQNDSTDDALFMNHLSSLFHLGKKLYEQGQYEKAYNIQMDALETISPFRSSCEESEIESGKNGKIINQFKNTKINPCAERLDAMIRYELANIEYTMVRENASTVTENGDNDVHDGRDQAIGDSTTAILSQLHSQVEYAKCRIAMVNYQYYKRELTAVENSNDGSDLNQIYNKLYILHNLGKLCDEDLHLYDEALKYYQHALSIETAVLDAFQKSNNSMHANKDATASDSKLTLGSKSHTPSQMRGELDWDTREFTERVRKTKDKIGSIYYTSGRFDLALLSSFSS